MFLLFLVALYLNWFDVKAIVYDIGFIKVSISAQVSNALVNISVFFSKCIVSTIRWNNSLVIIKSRMEIVGTTKGAADVYRASYELMNSRANKKQEIKKLSPVKIQVGVVNELSAYTDNVTQAVK